MDQVAMLELSQTMCLLQGFRKEQKAEPSVMFVAGRAQFDEAELLYCAGKWLGEHNKGRYLVFPGHDGSYANGKRVETGYAGFKRWQNWIVGYGLSARRVLSCVVREGHEQITHTREETDGFVLRAKEKKWKSAIALAHPHQLPRLMGCILKSMEEVGYSLDVFPRPPETTEWHVAVYGSLGQQSLPRWQHIEEELSRVGTYQEKGWMVSLAQVRDYLLQLYAPSY